MEGTVTSVNLDEKSCWWTKKGRTGYGSREKEHFSGSSLYVKTPHNTEVITKLVELNDKIKELQKKDAELRNSLEGRIDLAYFKKDSLQEG